MGVCILVRTSKDDDNPKDDEEEVSTLELGVEAGRRAGAGCENRAI